jgi:hypothetical protein
MKPTDAVISKFILVRNSTCFGQFLCPSSGVFHCTFGTGICYTCVRTAFVQDQDGTELHPDPALYISEDSLLAGSGWKSVPS